MEDYRLDEVEEAAHHPKAMNDSPGVGDQIGASTIAAANCLAARSTYGARPLSFPRAGPQSHRLPITMKDRPLRSRLPWVFWRQAGRCLKSAPKSWHDSTLSSHRGAFLAWVTRPWSTK
jgi:hypothetical protein